MIPDKLINFMCYENGNKIIGAVDVTLPDIAFMSEAIKGAGIAGEIDMPVIGQTQAMSTTINWRSLIENNIRFNAPKTYNFDFRGSEQMYDEGSGELTTKSIKVVMRCVPKKTSPGKFDVGASMGTSGEFEVVYLKISIANKDYLEIDKFNYVYKVDGTDYLAKVRKDLGLS